MILILSISVLLFASVRLIVSLVNKFTDNHIYPASSNARVSVLIPARNEAANLPRLLKSLQNQSLKPFEILVYNDQSTDDTAEIVLDFAKSNPTIQLIQGIDLPSGWLGKNHACYQLGLKAKGDLFLFLDADVQLESTAIERSSAHLNTKKLSLLSIFPYQKFMFFGEERVVPLMHQILLSLLPLRLVNTSSNPSFAAANGQFMLFDGTDYRQHSFHEKCKMEVVEDIAIMRYVKKVGLLGDVRLGKGTVSCYMYSDGKAAVEGFSKNLAVSFGGKGAGLALMLGLMYFFHPFIWFSPYWWMSAISIVFAWCCWQLNLTENSMVWMQRVIYYPLFQQYFILTSINSIAKTQSKNLEWKGRKLG